MKASEKVSKKEIKIVAGANWGDEGKGLATDYFARKAIAQNKKTLIVLHNGSCQRSHTVSLEDGTRHAFRHIGAATFAGADTLIVDTFIANPIYFMDEIDYIEENGYFPKVFISKNCRVATPVDGMYSQSVEAKRGKKKHGGCGFGVFETITRYKSTDMPFPRYDGIKFENVVSYYTNVIDYYEQKEAIEDYWNKFAMMQFIESTGRMNKRAIKVDNYKEIFEDYDCIIFEGGQGLALDMDNMDDFPHLTPSKTGSTNPVNIMLEAGLDMDKCDVEFCYITRSYFTKHGAGKFKAECPKEDINPDIVDLTNVPNPFQDSIRYGHMDIDDMIKRIDKDFAYTNKLATKAKKSIMVTHLNYKDFDFDKLQGFDNIYKSDNMVNTF